MTDTVSKQKRSEIMSAIRGSNTKPEVFVRHLLWSEGFRYRLKSKEFGHPDVFLHKYNTAVFVHGCFWHRHPGCKVATTPKSNVEYWTGKFARNQQRDAEVKETLAARGVKVLVVWECTVRKAMRKSGDPQALADAMAAFIRSDEPFLEL